MSDLRASAIVELIAAVEQVRAVITQHPALGPVATELLQMTGPLPHVRTNGAASLGSRVTGRTSTRLHWTQRPENRAKVMKLAKKMQRGK